MMSGKPIGLKIYYSWGLVVIPVNDLLLKWPSAPSKDVQFIAVFFDSQYQIFKLDGYDNVGQPINQRIETENYIHVFGGMRGGTLDLNSGLLTPKQIPSADYFWIDARMIFGCGGLVDVPNGLDAGFVKAGSLIADSDYALLAKAVFNDRKW